jgi:hypothetical protein
MITAIIRHHHALGTPISAATLTRIRATLRVALNAAIRRGLLADNPASRAESPKVRRPKAVVWTPYRIEAWRRSAERPTVAVWTAAQTARLLNSIAEHRLYAAYHLIALRAHRDRQQREATAYGPGYRMSGFVFTNLNGDPMAPDRLHDLRHGAATLALAAGWTCGWCRGMLDHPRHRKRVR